MLPTEELFVYVYVLVHDLLVSGAVQIPRRPGPELHIGHCRISPGACPKLPIASCVAHLALSEAGLDSAKRSQKSQLPDVE